MVQDHNRAAAQLWSKGGAGYDRIPYTTSDSMLHAARRLWARPGDRILDIATGTGWTARNVARDGAIVTGVDIAEDLLEAAKELSSHVTPAIEFRLADAESLPFDDASFDGVISTFGIMFAGNQEQAAAEAARVCRPGGRISLTTWSPDPNSFSAKFFRVIAKYTSAPPPAVSPMEWGKPARVRELLGAQFDLVFEERESVYFCPSGADAWDEFSESFGPIKALAENLEEGRRAEFREDFISFHEKYRTGAGLTMPRKYLLSVGVRK